MGEEIKVIMPHIYGLPSDVAISPHELRKYPWIRMYLYKGNKKELKTVIATEEGLQGFIYIEQETGITQEEVERPDISYLKKIVRKFPKFVVYHCDKLEVSGAKYVKVYSWADFLSNSNNMLDYEIKRDIAVLPPSINTFQVVDNQAGVIPGMSYIVADNAVYLVLRPHCWKRPDGTKVYDLGRVVVRIDPKSRSKDHLDFTNLHDLFGDSSNSHPHPHIRDHACFGNVADQINLLLETRDYSTLRSLFDAFVADVNIEDSWGSEISTWPEAIGVRRDRNE